MFWLFHCFLIESIFIFHGRAVVRREKHRRKKHIRDEERLNQALNRKLPNFFEDLSEVLRKYNVDSMPEIAFDCCKYVLEEIHLRKINLPEYKF